MIIFAGILFAVTLTSLFGLLGGNVVFFLDMPSLFFILLPLAFFLFITKSGKAIWNYMKVSFKRNHEYSATELSMIAMSAKNITKFTLIMGVLSLFAGLIITLGRLDSPENIGPIFAISLISLYYAIAIAYLIFFPLQVWADSKVALTKDRTGN